MAGERADLDEQIAYYRARASEYDREYAEAGNVMAYAQTLLDSLRIGGDVLEIACGTGQWTRLLAPRANSLTAMDAAPETLAIAAERVPGLVRWQVQDVFTWEPDRRYDVIFFGFWLSHVPWPDWPDYWQRLGRALKPGGHVSAIDETAEYVRDNETWEVFDHTVRRRLSDGRTFTAIKTCLARDRVGQELAAVGWEPTSWLQRKRYLAMSAAPRHGNQAGPGRR